MPPNSEAKATPDGGPSRPPRFSTLVDIYEDSVHKHGARELFGTKKNGIWTWTTYAEFGSMVERIRGGLASLGLERGDRLAVIANNRPEWAVLAYAAFGLGVAYVPMYEAQHDKDWEFIVNDCAAKVLVVANEAIFAKAKGFLGKIRSLKHIVVLDGGPDKVEEQTSSFRALLDAGKQAPTLHPSKEDIACTIYTSGTTGNPKGVLLSHWNIASNVSAVHDIFPISEDDRSLSFLPWAHSFGQTCELHALLSNGASIAICEAVDKIIDNLAEVRPTLLFSVPRIFNKLYTAVQKQLAGKPKPIQAMVKAALKATAKERAGHRLSITEHAMLVLTDKLVFSKVRARFGGRLKYAFSGGAAISREVAEFIDSLGITVYEGYGLTETSPITTANYPGFRKIGSVGRPIPGVRVEIDASVLSPPGGNAPDKKGRVEGEIIVHGPNVMVGYHNRPDENAQVFTKDHGFRTGDMGCVDAEGFLYITGRIKEQYKLENGKYVVPTPLEESLKLSPYVANVMVYGDNRPYNVALVVADAGALKKWATENGQATSDVESLLKNEKVRDLFKNEIERFSAQFKGFESVNSFALIADDFTTENGMLTPSLKLKRRKVLEVHGPLLDSLYAKKAKPAEKPRTAAQGA
jgi:long-chain acyl-CoA synthetase